MEALLATSIVGTLSVKGLQLEVIKLQIGNMRPDYDKSINPQPWRVYSINDVCPTLMTKTGGGMVPQILVRLCSEGEAEHGRYKTSD